MKLNSQLDHNQPKINENNNNWQQKIAHNAIQIKLLKIIKKKDNEIFTKKVDKQGVFIHFQIGYCSKKNERNYKNMRKKKKNAMQNKVDDKNKRMK